MTMRCSVSLMPMKRFKTHCLSVSGLIQGAVVHGRSQGHAQGIVYAVARRREQTAVKTDFGHVLQGPDAAVGWP